jgi:prepilin peptidase CpaA
MSDQAYFDLSLLVLLFLACGFDLAQRRIPNRLLAAGIACAATLHLLFGTPLALLSTMLAGGAVGLLMFLPLYMFRAMAAGDVKLMATVGAFTGPSLCVEIGLATYCAGGLLALGIVLWRRRWGVASANMLAVLRPWVLRMAGVPAVAEPAPHPSVGGMPYALAIAAGSVGVLLLRHS